MKKTFFIITALLALNLNANANTIEIEEKKINEVPESIEIKPEDSKEKIEVSFDQCELMAMLLLDAFDSDNSLSAEMTIRIYRASVDSCHALLN